MAFEDLFNSFSGAVEKKADELKRMIRSECRKMSDSQLRSYYNRMTPGIANYEIAEEEMGRRNLL